MTTLHLAALNGSCEITAQLLNDGVPIDLWESRYGTPLCAASLKGQIEVIELLLERGADLNGRGYYGGTPLSHAAGYDQVDAMALLLRRGADIEAKDDGGRTALCTAVVCGKAEAVRFLAQQGANINHMPDHGSPPLHTAIIAGHLEVVEVLLDSGAQLDSKNSDGHPAFLKAIPMENLAMMQLFADRGVDMNSAHGGEILPLFLVFASKKKECIRFVLENGADLRKTGFHDRTIFHLAAELGDLSILQLLLEFTRPDASGKRSLLNVKNDEHDAPLHVAAKLGHFDIVKELVEAGAEIDITDDMSGTPLSYASAKKHVKICEYLLQHGATQETRNQVVEVFLRNGRRGEVILGPTKDGRKLTKEEILTIVHDTDFGSPVERVQLF